MDENQALLCYARAAAGEREEYLYQQTLKKSGALADRVTAEEKERIIQSQTFSAALYRAKRQDKAYQALTRGELVLEYHQAEFEELRPLIESELRHGHDIDLPFLRSVEKSRVTLGKARAAIRQLEQQGPRKFFQSRRQHFVSEAEKYTELYLRKADLAPLARDEKGENVVSRMLNTAFVKGLSPETIDRAFQPQPLKSAMEDALYQAYPTLAACGGVTMESGEKVYAAVKSEIRRAQYAVCAEVARRFPAKRIRRLLGENPSLRRLQKQADAAKAREKRLHSALLDAIPEHYRDLYPLARAMRRRFILHLGPTNSGKTYEGVRRLRGAKNGIYLGPLRLLAAEQFETLNVNDVPCSLVTGGRTDSGARQPGAVLHRGNGRPEDPLRRGGDRRMPIDRRPGSGRRVDGGHPGPVRR